MCALLLSCPRGHFVSALTWGGETGGVAELGDGQQRWRLCWVPVQVRMRSRTDVGGAGGMLWKVERGEGSAGSGPGGGMGGGVVAMTMTLV